METETRILSEALKREFLQSQSKYIVAKKFFETGLNRANEDLRVVFNSCVWMDISYKRMCTAQGKRNSSLINDSFCEIEEYSRSLHSRTSLLQQGLVEIEDQVSYMEGGLSNAYAEMSTLLDQIKGKDGEMAQGLALPDVERDIEQGKAAQKDFSVKASVLGTLALNIGRIRDAFAKVPKSDDDFLMVDEKDAQTFSNAIKPMIQEIASTLARTP